MIAGDSSVRTSGNAGTGGTRYRTSQWLATLPLAYGLLRWLFAARLDPRSSGTLLKVQSSRVRSRHHGRQALPWSESQAFRQHFGVAWGVLTHDANVIEGSADVAMQSRIAHLRFFAAPHQARIMPPHEPHTQHATNLA